MKNSVQQTLKTARSGRSKDAIQAKIANSGDEKHQPKIVAAGLSFDPTDDPTDSSPEEKITVENLVEGKSSGEIAEESADSFSGPPEPVEFVRRVLMELTEWRDVSDSSKRFLATLIAAASGDVSGDDESHRRPAMVRWLKFRIGIICSLTVAVTAVNVFLLISSLWGGGVDESAEFWMPPT